MDIPVLIQKDPTSVYGVIVPDIAGCHSWGDTIEHALRNVKEAIAGHIETALELGMPVDIRLSDMESLTRDAQYAGGIWALVDVDLSKLDATPERINISLPRFVLSKIDTYVGARHETRSGFLARAALAAIAADEQAAVAA